MVNNADLDTGVLLSSAPLTPKFGAEIFDVDLSSDIGSELFSLIYQAFLDYQVLVFRGQNISPADHVRIARDFGEVQIHVMNQYHADSYPELYFLSNLDTNGSPNGKHPDQGTLAWHTDGSWQRITGQATMIYSIEVPAHGVRPKFVICMVPTMSLTKRPEITTKPYVQYTASIIHARRIIRMSH